MAIYYMMFLSGLLGTVNALEPNNGYWCALAGSPESRGAIGRATSAKDRSHISFRGEYRDFDLFVEEKEDMLEGCIAFKSHMLLGDGLWVIEEPNTEKYEETKAKLIAADLPIFYTRGFTIVAGGGETLPSISGLDGCGADEDTSVIPVPTHSVVFPELSEIRRQEWSERRMVNSDVSSAVGMVDEKSLISSMETLQSFFSRNSYSDTINEAQAFLSNRLEELGFDVELQKFRSDMAPNVIATWPSSTSSSEWVVAGAHYDSRSVNSSSGTSRAPGADDNGSGTSCMLELASIVNASEFELSRGLKICFFAGEEQGLLGSQALASAWSKAGKDIVAMVNADMLGYQPGEEITLGFKDRSVTPELVMLSKQLTEMYVPGLPVADSSSCCSDYLSFYENGFPAVGFFESGFAASDYPSYHTSTDLLTYVNTKQLTMETQAVVATVFTLVL